MLMEHVLVEKAWSKVSKKKCHQRSGSTNELGRLSLL